MTAKIAIAAGEFCLRWRITEFFLFGSVLRDDFRQDSDVDVMVSFEECAGSSLFDIVDMQEELKDIFGREVDLVEKRRNRQSYSQAFHHE